MGDTNFDVLSMIQCNSYGTSGCDFSKSFALASKVVKPLPVKAKHAVEGRTLEELLAPAAADSCGAYGDCDTCLGDASGVCGWCDGVVTDVNGNVVCGEDGNGCCGGSDGFSYCNVAFRKTCPVVCGA
jgi:hypothetical protein